MDRWHNHYIDNCAHFCTWSANNFNPVLIDNASIIYDFWNESRTNYGVCILAYVIMPEHIHILLWAESGNSIKLFLQRSLARSAKAIGSRGQFWKERPRVLPIYTQAMADSKIEYIHRNPLRRGVADEPEDWVHSSYRQLVLGVHEVEFLCDNWQFIDG